METATKLATNGTDVEEEDATEKSVTKGAKPIKLDGSAKPRNLEGSAATVASVVAGASAKPAEDGAVKSDEEDEDL